MNFFRVEYEHGKEPLHVWHNKKILPILSALFILFSLTACATAEGQSSQQDYEGQKKMIIDMLKTTEGKEAIKEVLKDEEIKSEIVMEDSFIKDTIQTTLTSETGKEYWQKLMEDPEFAKTYAEAIQTENEKIIKSLMKDPEYQGMMISLLKDPEMEKEYLTLMGSKQYREQVMTVIEEAFQSPFFTAKINEILKKVAEEQKKKEEEEQKKKEEESSGGDSSDS